MARRCFEFNPSPIRQAHCELPKKKSSDPPYLRDSVLRDVQLPCASEVGPHRIEIRRAAQARRACPSYPRWGPSMTDPERPTPIRMGCSPGEAAGLLNG